MKKAILKGSARAEPIRHALSDTKVNCTVTCLYEIRLTEANGEAKKASFTQLS